ncbi:uncharacterized protein LOC108914083, partial [Anoplophora glabripennis]|uniref:uncharacterized protein LOC108914083 n=1 Tax=Anoplophora glabripennis TaxID=217634 RepID=UPI0008734FA0
MDSLMERNVCRLCLTTKFDNCLTITEEIALEFSDVLLLYLNFSVSNNPIICTECEKNLHNTIGFKSSRKVLLSLYSDDEMMQYFSATTGTVEMKLCYFCINYPVHVRPIPGAESNVFVLEILREISTEL